MEFRLHNFINQKVISLGNCKYKMFLEWRQIEDKIRQGKKERHNLVKYCNMEQEKLEYEKKMETVRLC